MIRTTTLAVLSFFAIASQAADSVPAVRTTFDHPAVAVARLNQVAHVDTNTFLVQPPASVTWTVQPEASLVVTVAAVASK